MEWRKRAKSRDSPNVFPEFYTYLILSWRRNTWLNISESEQSSLRFFHTYTQLFTHTTHLFCSILGYFMSADTFFLFLVSNSDFAPLLYFSTNLPFMSLHPWQHLDFLSILLPSVTLKWSLKGVVDCTVAHTAVIQCYWGCYNSFLCDQEPHSPGGGGGGGCTSWQTAQVKT